jgi:hypothetical protein
MTNKMQLCRIIYCSLTSLHVSSDIFTHHQEHLNCMYSFWCYSHASFSGWCRGWIVSIKRRYQPATTQENNTRNCTYSLDASDDERKYRSKHVEQSRNIKLSYPV